jgi:hypothetical protein
LLLSVNLLAPLSNVGLAVALPGTRFGFCKSVAAWPVAGALVKSGWFIVAARRWAECVSLPA